jgi:predicted flap endonuclease-1-like 5' DNA nuclease
LAATPDKSLRKVDHKKKEAKPFKAEKEDLTLIEGIGEKTAAVLNEKGIQNYLQLANCSSETLDDILKESFPNYRVFNTLTWPEQALLAHSGKWEELKILQDKLNGGR